MKRPAFMRVEEVEQYIKRGFRNFKIVGRGLPKQFVLDSYVYFMVKEGLQDFIRGFVINALRQMNAKTI